MRAIDGDALYDMISDNICHDIMSVADVLDFIKSAPPLDCTLESAWISVKDRLPEHNVLVLCVWLDGRDRKQNRGFATYQQHGVWYVSNEGMPEVTNWMPLPELPKEDEQDG